MSDLTRSSNVSTDEPSRLNFDDHAKISAEIAEGTASEAEILKRHSLSEKEWATESHRIMMALAEDVQQRGAEAQLPLRYSDVFAEHQQSLKPVVAFTPEQWAELEFDIERSESPELPLAQRQLSMADYIRLVRVYAKRIADEPEVASRVDLRRAELENCAGK